MSATLFPWLKSCAVFRNSINQNENFTDPALYYTVFFPSSFSPYKIHTKPLVRCLKPLAASWHVAFLFYSKKRTNEILLRNREIQRSYPRELPQSLTYSRSNHNSCDSEAHYVFIDEHWWCFPNNHSDRRKRKALTYRGRCTNRRAAGFSLGSDSFLPQIPSYFTYLWSHFLHWIISGASSVSLW